MWCVGSDCRAGDGAKGERRYDWAVVAASRPEISLLIRRSIADGDGQAASSANEIRRIFTALCGPSHGEQHARNWSRWHHRHQDRARRHHYQRQRLENH